MSADPAPPRRSTGYLLLYALASAGGVIAYLPLLLLLLPMRIDAVVGDARIGLFASTAIIGAVAASASNIAFGWLSDGSVARGGGRRGWIWLGLAMLVGAYTFVAMARTPLAIVGAIVAVQVAVNALLAPLLAIMADEIPDAQKGIASGLLALGAPVASAFSAALMGIALLDEGARFAVIPVAVALCVIPLLFTRAGFAEEAPVMRRAERLARRDLLIAWGARLLVQIAGAVLSLYLLYYFQSVAPDVPSITAARRIGQLMTIVYILSLPAAVLLGRLSDRTRRRKPILLGSAILAAAGLATMALARDWPTGAVGYGLYAIGSAVFLALHAGFAMLLLPNARHRGRDLGLLNLTNTLPSLIGPALTWALATPRDFAPAMAALTLLTLGGGIAVLAVRGRD